MTSTPNVLEAPLERVQALMPELTWTLDRPQGSTGLWLWCLIGTSASPSLPLLIVDGWTFDGFEGVDMDLSLHDPGNSDTASAYYALAELTTEALRAALAKMRRDLLKTVRCELLCEMRPQPGEQIYHRRFAAHINNLLDPQHHPVEDLVGDWALLASDDRTEWTLCATSALLGTLQREPHMRPLEILRGCTWAEAKAIKDLWIEESSDAAPEEHTP